MKQINEPPSCPSHTVFIGQNQRGDWVAQEQHGLFGGLFINYIEAERYALFENGHHKETIIRVIGNSLELNLSGSPQVRQDPEILPRSLSPASAVASSR